jgi:hypothetical protein
MERKEVLYFIYVIRVNLNSLNIIVDLNIIGELMLYMYILHYTITYAVTTQTFLIIRMSCRRVSAFYYYNCGSAYNSYSDSYFAYKEVIDIYYWGILLWDELLEVTFVFAGAFFFNGGLNLRLAEEE